MSDQLTKGFVSVMNNRVEGASSLDDFPTPPFATRSLFEHVLWPSARENLRSSGIVWEPACGRRIMSEVIAEYAKVVFASDIEDYGYGTPVRNYLTDEDRPIHHWMITNPPFNLALDFVLKGLSEARQGVAILVRSNWIEGVERHTRLFADRPPTIIAPFVERVPMVKGRWDPKASTATSYSWFVWDTESPTLRAPKVVWIPPGQRKALTRDTDVERFASRGLIEEMAQ